MAKPYYKVDNLEASNSVGYLVKRCGVLMAQIAERRFETLSVSFTQWVTLMRLGDQPSPISATQLSKELGHDMGALTRVVDELERRGLVKVSIDDADKRAVDWQRDLTEALMANTRDSPASRRRLSQPSPSK